MEDFPFFSICIPTYNSVVFLKKLIASIEAQNFSSFEVIVSDDSTNNDVRDFVFSEQKRLNHIFYYKRSRDGNATNNWNSALALAKGEYKMLVHHDDYFSHNEMLKNIYTEIKKKNKLDVVFLSFEEESHNTKFFYGKYCFENLLKNPSQLLYVNYLSTPSCLILNKNVGEIYDNQLKWIVDVEFYIRLIKKYKNVIHLNKEKIIIGGDERKITNTNN